MRIDFEIVGEAELTKRYLAGATATKMPKAGEPNDATASELYQSIQISEKELNDFHSKDTKCPILPVTRTFASSCESVAPDDRSCHSRLLLHNLRS